MNSRVAAQNWETSIRSRRLATALLIVGTALVLLHPGTAGAQAGADGDRRSPTRILVIEVTGLIDPIQADFLSSTLTRAAAEDAEVVVVRLDAAGGVLSGPALDRLVTTVAASPVPVAAWVGPSRSSRAGGQAARLYAAAHVRGLAPGARAAPAQPGAQARPLSAATLGDFIVDLDGRRAAGRTIAIPTRIVDRPGGIRQREPGPGARVRFAEPSLLAQLLHAVASPTAAYLLVVIALLLVVFELYTAGVGVAAVVAILAAALGAYGLGVLPTRPAGLALLAAGVFGFTVDVQAGAPRVWTAIGTVAFATGSVTLYQGFRVPLVVLALVVAGVALFMVSAMPAVVRARFSTATIGREGLIGEEGVAVSPVDPDGVVKVRDAAWRARTNRATPIAPGQALRVAAIDGLVLEVEPLEGAARDARH